MGRSNETLIRILLVDDHTIVCSGLRMLIESRPGFAVTRVARTPEEALEAAREQPDVILLDLDLGETSGLDLLPRLIQAAPQAKVLILTGVRDQEAHRRAIRSGAMGVVLKDRAVEDIFEAVGTVHSGGAWVDRRLVADLISEMSGGRQAADPEAQRIASLTEREREVVRLVGEGLRNQQIADRLFISEGTVRHHLTSVFEKLDVSDRLELVVYAYRHRLAQLP